MTVPRLSARAIIVADNKLLLVNATPDKDDGNWCTPGGGVEKGEDLKLCVAREIREETGLKIEVHDIVAASENFDHVKNVHQIDLFFAATAENPELPEDWEDVADVVAHRGFFSLEEIQNMEVFPRFLKKGAWLEKAENSSIYQGFDVKK